MQEWICRYSELLSIAVYLLPPVLSLTLLYFLRRKYIWLSIPITAACDIIVWGAAFSSSYGRGITALFLISQLAIVSLISLLITRSERKKSRT